MRRKRSYKTFLKKSKSFSLQSQTRLKKNLPVQRKTGVLASTMLPTVPAKSLNWSRKSERRSERKRSKRMLSN